MNNKRPVNLDLTTMKFPIPAIASILHRISGVVLFCYLPFLLWILSSSLDSPGDFYNLQTEMSQGFYWILFTGFFAALIYHLLAGFRHIIMDMGWGESLESARRSAYAVIVIAMLLTVLAGVWLW